MQEPEDARRGYVLVVAPLRAEITAFVAALAARGYQAVETRVGRIDAMRFETLRVVLARGGHGKTQFGVQTQHLLDNVDVAPVAVICLGAAGALDERIAVGDVVVARETVEHDYTERFTVHPLPRFPGDATLLHELALAAAELPTILVHFGVVASGDEDVIELERGMALRHATDACAVAWEGAGGARAARFSGVPFVEIRGITDTADHNAAEHFTINLELAMTSIAELIIALRTRP